MENKKIKQVHLGRGDNVGGDKFVMRATGIQKKKKWTIYRVAAWAGILSLVFYLFFSFVNMNKDQTSFNSGDNVAGDKETEQTHYGSGDNVAGDKIEVTVNKNLPQINLSGGTIEELENSGLGESYNFKILYNYKITNEFFGKKYNIYKVETIVYDEEKTLGVFNTEIDGGPINESSAEISGNVNIDLSGPTKINNPKLQAVIYVGDDVVRSNIISLNKK